jgi:hypothetical protein
MTNQVYALIRSYSDNCTYTAEDFDSLELFFNKEDAELRKTELELEIFDSGREEYEDVYLKLIEIK